jgi:signal transduction histidine kinase
VLTLVEKRCRDHNVEVVYEADKELPTLQASADQIQQVFLNLVLNALEVMPYGGRLTVTTERTAEPEGVRVSLSDSGPGIPPEAQKHLFEPFQTTKKEGLGLGLYVSRRIVRHHGGELSVKSEPGEGSTFVIWLPKDREEKEE